MAARKKKEAPAPVAKPVKRVPKKPDGLDKKTLELIESTARNVNARILKRNLPELSFPTRSLANVN